MSHEEHQSPEKYSSRAPRFLLFSSLLPIFPLRIICPTTLKTLRAVFSPGNVRAAPKEAIVYLARYHYASLKAKDNFPRAPPRPSRFRGSLAVDWKETGTRGFCCVFTSPRGLCCDVVSRITPRFKDLGMKTPFRYAVSSERQRQGKSSPYGFCVFC